MVFHDLLASTKRSPISCVYSRSRFHVGSSAMTNSGLLTMALAMATFCFSHPERALQSILFMSSETSHTADIRPYGLTKAAINSLVKGLASMYASHGIRVNAVAPGITTSDMTGYKTDGNLYLEANATGRVYLPEEVAECASFLLSDCSGCVSGEILTCNNGKTINARWK